jgi:2-dehydro-3-deoxyphosphogluconate aldolase / (4S)-4-hydroxy-2-oxoglutarate aldolase
MKRLKPGLHTELRSNRSFQMHPDQVCNRVAQYGVVPIIVIDEPQAALPLADALLAGGLPVLEITFRTKAAAEALRLLREHRPNVLAGAGTILTLENLEAARESGAAFALAPGLNPAIVKEAQKIGMPLFPGVATASEIDNALNLGCRVLKLFPAELLGGIPMLQALADPFRHAGVKFLPTGGINAANLEAYLKLDVVAAVGGTWIARKTDLAAGNWDQIQHRCREAALLVQSVRGSGRQKL